jgi:serine protease Do
MKRHALLFLFFSLCFAVFIAMGPVSLQAAEKAGGATDLSTAIIRVAKQNIPAVVHIDVTERQEVVNPFQPYESDPFFRYFFNNPQMPKKFKRELKGIGTGMIINPDGHILTNHHVAGGATKIQVTLADGNQYPAKLIGTDPKTDLAVIKIDAKERLSYITFGDSDAVEVGEWVVAIGHPRGLDQTVTQGIISAKHRRGITDPTSYQDFLQTDAAINPGNSGGPLLNLQGEVVGVNAVIASESGGSEGIGFAIPSNMAVYISKVLMAHGKVDRGWIGVSIQDLTPELAKTSHMDLLKGAYIAEVVKGGPADKAGLKKGDVVTACQGKEIPDSGAFRNQVANLPIGQDADLTIVRDGQKKGIKIRVENLDAANKILAASIKDRLGVTVRPVTPKESEKYGLEPKQGVGIATVDPKGPLGEAGFEVGDIILAINGQPISGVESFVGLVSAFKTQAKIILMALDHRTGNSGAVETTIR